MNKNFIKDAENIQHVYKNVILTQLLYAALQQQTKFLG